MRDRDAATAVGVDTAGAAGVVGSSVPSAAGTARVVDATGGSAWPTRKRPSCR